ncbi:cell division protein [Aquibacillus halophilus]|uniref:Cell division protein n=1 Tax=Aquibacillus halophilus TaxID=930132 RepID=A0A6A8DIR5_9BACI|nr:cell division FtsA domain-containing protein [Aquibacillus halophilus]MRH42827.1 cell division protein [Aquibacillus halophilus]
MSERIFALDIGTRTVVGLIMEKKQQKFELIDYCIKEHDERSMLDGQIHDVVSVANIIIEVKETLEKRQGKLTKVCVAAAGRALKTKRTSITKNISEQPLIDKEDILYLELSAVQKAQYDLAIEEVGASSSHYYCVGYSVLQYQLDDQIIGSLIDQQGENAKIEIIATFLPKVVVESLISALVRAELEMEALTLEPIAAINVLIPPSMRRLNVALIDIGAGTSDIALTNEGAISAYGMVPIAGDEITEAISDHYLLDFPQAELLKRDITTNHSSTITDILGFEQTIKYNDLVEAISVQIDGLVENITDEIIELNGQAPKAVMLVGGGSLTPDITNRLAKKLNLPNNRVAIRGIDAIQSLIQTNSTPTGPDFVTPIGIAIASKENPVNYISVSVNDRAVRLFDMKQLTVGDCLLAAGINLDKLYGRPGGAYIITLNGREITLPGSYGDSPNLWLNNESILVDAPIEHGDILTVIKGENGSEPVVNINELIGELPHFSVTFNGKIYNIKPDIIVNNQMVNDNYIVQDHDSIYLTKTRTIKEFLTFIGKSDIENQIYPFFLEIDGTKRIISEFDSIILLNDKKTGLDATIKEKDEIMFTKSENPTVVSVLSHINVDYYEYMKVHFNGQPVTLKKRKVKVTKKDYDLQANDILSCGDAIKIKKQDNTPFIFQDIFRHVSIDLSQVKGTVKILKNDKPANFNEELSANDFLEIIWD